MTQDVEDANAPAPRLCHVTRWVGFDGYGFNLHSDKSRAGQFIGKVDENSPAEAAGLRKGDRIVEVNGVNVANENHKQVVERIKAVPDETRLLVVDAETDTWFKENKIVIRAAIKNVVYLQNPATRPPIHKKSETVINDLIEEKAPPIPAVNVPDRRASVRSNDPPSKSGSINSSTPPPHKKRSSVTAVEHVEEHRKSISNDDHPILYSSVEIPEERDDGKSVNSEEIFNNSEEISKNHVQHDHEMIEKYQESTSSVDVEHLSKDELASKLVGFRPLEDNHESAPPMPVLEVPHFVENLRKQSALSHTEEDHHHDLPNHTQVHFSPSTADNLDELEVKKRESFPSVHDPELLPPAPKSPTLERKTSAHGSPTLERKSSTLGSPTLERKSSTLASPTLERKISTPGSPTSVKSSSKSSVVENLKENHSPILERPDSGTVREELFESSKIERNNRDDHSPVAKRSSFVETSPKTSENGDSSSNSSRSMETGSYNLGGEKGKQHNHEDLGFDENKTPSPSPAVVPDSYRPTISPSHSNVKSFAPPVIEKEREVPVVAAVTPKTTPVPPKPTPNYNGLTLHVTAQEMRETLSRRRKIDPRTQSIDMKKKHELIDNL